MDKKTLSFIVPVWNEEKTLKELVEKVLAVQFPENIVKEIILVNDASKDSTPAIMQELAKNHPEVKAFDNSVNSGKTQTVKNGIAKSTGDYVVIQDADLEYDPTEIVPMLNLMIEKNLDVVYGNRFGKYNKVGYWKNYIGNHFLSFFSNVFTFPRIRVWIADMEVCYKLMRGEIARELGAGIESKSKFGLEPEITAKLSKYKLNGKHLKFATLPISYYPRTMEEGKKMNAMSDGIKAIKEVFIFNVLK